MWRELRHICGICILFLVACGNPKPNASVQLSLTGAKECSILLEEIDVRSVLRIDSAKIALPGYIAFDLTLHEASFFRIVLDNEKSVPLVMKPGDHLVVSADLKSFPHQIIIVGSEESVKLNDFYLRSEKNRIRADSIQELLVSNTGSPDFAALTESSVSEFAAILNDQKRMEKDFIRSSPSYLASLIVLNYGFGPKPVLTMEEDMDLYLLIDSALAWSYPKNKHLIYHHKRILEFQNQQVVKKD